MTSKRIIIALVSILSLCCGEARHASAAGDPTRGQQVFRACAACHSLEPGRQMTGPSLAGLWDRKAGSLADFPRYSAALKSSGIIWNDKSLDEWLADPQHVVPGNQMTFAGIKDARQRADLLSFLKEATQPGAKRGPTQDRMGNMGGMMGSDREQKLKTVGPQRQVRTIRYCGDTYKVTTGDGKTRNFWERNLRFKTDRSDDGPAKGMPVILPAGMMGDRASIIFAAPEEFSAFIKQGC